MEKWPNFFIVGANKAGTTSLYEYLKDIPGIYMSPVKEPKYFSEAHNVPGFPRKRRNEEQYFSLFNGVKDEKIIGEASSDYLGDPKAPFSIHDINPTANILISLRDPVERLFSAYLMYIKFGYFKASFCQEIENSMKNYPMWMERGIYFDSVKRYLELFGTKHVKILIFEEWIKNPKNTVQEILQFLGINYEINDFKEEIYNPFLVSRGSIAKWVFRRKKIGGFAQKYLPSSTRRILKEKILTYKAEKPKMEKKDRDFLIDFYKDDVKKLANLLGQKLHWRNFTL